MADILKEWVEETDADEILHDVVATRTRMYDELAEEDDDYIRNQALLLNAQATALLAREIRNGFASLFNVLDKK